MSVPKPRESLEGHCAAIHDSRLWVVSPSGFQSLPLKKNDNAQWEKEVAGQSVTGSACVKSIPNGDESQAALYVIGGETDDSSYSGLQRYSFAEKKWETLPVAADVLKGRTNHSAAYLQDSQSIIVYAGSTPDAPSYLSSQTFLISTGASNGLLSFTSIAPPTHMPVLQPWNSSHAIMVAGTPSGSVIFTFGPSEGWQRYGTNLTDATPFNSATRGVIVDGTDNSKVLQLYDASASPNSVSSVVLQGPDGRPAANGWVLGESSSSTSTQKRDLTVNSWPAYNSTDAPRDTRDDYSITRQQNGMVWVAGGNSDLPIAMFDSNDNTWIDTSDFFNSKQQQPLIPATTVQPSSTPSSTSSPTSTSSSEPEAAAGHSNTMRTLGITLGVLCGVAVLFILLLLWLRWCKQKKQKQLNYVDEKNSKERMSFADRGASFMKEAGGSVNDLLAPPPGRFGSGSPNDPARGSNSSLAIIAGKFTTKRGSNHAPKGSFESTTRLVKDKDYEMVALDQRFPTPPSLRKTALHPERDYDKEIAVPEPVALPSDPATEKELKESRKRSSGWSKYFQTATAPNGLSHLPSAYSKPQHLSDASYYGEDRESNVPGAASGLTASNGFGTLDGQRLSHVAARSPAYTTSTDDLARRGDANPISEPQSGIIFDGTRRGSEVSISSYGGGAGRSTMEISRPTSSNYTASVYEPTNQKIPSRGRSANFFPGSGASYRPSSRPRTARSGTVGSEKEKPTHPPIVPLPQGLKNGITIVRPAEDRDSTVTVFPRGVTDSYYEKRDATAGASDATKPISTDTSWVDIKQ